MSREVKYSPRLTDFVDGHFGKAVAHLRELRFDVDREAEFVADAAEAVGDHVEERQVVDVIGDVGLAEIEQVGDLVVALEALARGRGDDEAPGGIGLDDGLDFLELFGVATLEPPNLVILIIIYDSVA